MYYHFSGDNVSKWRIVAGKYIKNKSEDMNQVRSIKKINKFHNPTNNFIDRDMASLIELDSPFVFNQYVSPVCLPTRNPTVNDYCVVAG